MVDSDDPTLPELLDRLRVGPIERSLFARTDREVMLTKVRHFAASAILLNAAAVVRFGGRLGPVRERGLVEQIVGAAFQTFGDTDPHPDPFDKAAMLLRGITPGHPFNDGNQRTGFLIAADFLDLIGYPFPELFDFDRAERLCMSVSAGRIRDVAPIAAELERLWAGPAADTIPDE